MDRLGLPIGVRSAEHLKSIGAEHAADTIRVGQLRGSHFQTTSPTEPEPLLNVVRQTSPEGFGPNFLPTSQTELA